MDRATILTPADCEVKQLPLAAVEAFVLSQIDGRLTLEELSEVSGLDFEKTAQLARRLVELGAVSVPGEPSKTTKTAHTKTPAPEPTREGQPAARTELRPASVTPRAEAQGGHVDHSRQPVGNHRPAPSVRRRSSQSAVRAQRGGGRSAARVDDDVCELDEATCTRIATLDGKLKTLDHYAALEVDRGAEKKAIKRAYFALASKFHPDRFFRKKLGRSRVPLERVFYRLTEAHDTLVDRARRAAYDATLPPAPSAPPARPSGRPSKGPPAKAESRPPPRRLSQKMKAAARQTPGSVPPAKRNSSAPKAKTERPPPRKTSPKMKAAATSSPSPATRPSTAPKPKTGRPPPRKTSPKMKAASAPSLAPARPSPLPLAPVRLSPSPPAPVRLSPSPAAPVRLSPTPPASARLSPAPPRLSAAPPSTRLSNAPGRADSLPPRSQNQGLGPRISLVPTQPRRDSLFPDARRSGPPPATDSGRPASGSPLVLSPKNANGLRRTLTDKEIEAHRRVDVFLQAAEEALRLNDLIGAANNYRLALQNTDDPAIRVKYEEVEERAKTHRYDKAMVRAAAAERDKRWEEAASQFAKVHDARPRLDPPIAHRAANALRLGGGDLHRAANLAEHAVAGDAKNAAYRVTLAEVYAAANLFTRAAAEAARALELAPNDPRARELAETLAKRKK